MNTTHPGLPNYTGPTKGWFANVHHGPNEPVDYSYNILERVEFIRERKRPSEIPARLAALALVPMQRVPSPVRETRAALLSSRKESWEAHEEARTAYCKAIKDHRAALLALAHEYAPGTRNEMGLIFPRGRKPWWAVYRQPNADGSWPRRAP